PDGQVDRTLPAPGGGAVPPPGRGSRGTQRTRDRRRGTGGNSGMSDITEATIEVDPKLPLIRITREFAATPEQLLRGHTEPALFAQWVGPHSTPTRIDQWDARTGGSFRYVSILDGQEFAFRGCFHEIRPDRIVQTFTYEAEPDGVALETLWFEDLGNGRTLLRAQSLVDSFEGRDAWLRSGMEVGVNDGYAKLERMIADGAV